MLHSISTRAKRAAALFICAALLAPLCRAGGYAPDIDLWPFVYAERDEEAGERLVEVLGPVFEYRDTPDSRAVYVRPLYNRISNKNAPKAERETLWPFAFGTKSSTLDRSWVFPLYQRSADTSGTGEVRRRSLHFLPFLVHRSPTGDKPRDLLVWPFWGRLHNWYDRERVDIVAWPFYIHQRREEAQSWDTPWPFVTFVRWEDGGRGWRLWPLYGRNRRPGRLDKRFALWPFYTSLWARTKDGHETDRWMLWPFYGQIRSDSGHATVWAWPFFEHRVDHVQKIDQWSYPWPFLGHTKGLDGAAVEGRRFWPFYVWENRGDTKSRQILWPFFWHETHTPADPNKETSTFFRFVPFVLHAREEAGGEKTGVTQLWPLYRWERKEGGVEESEFLSLWPGRSGTGWTRNWAPFFRLYHRVKTDEGRDARFALGRLIRSEKTPEDRFFEFKPFLRVHRRFSETEKDGTVSRTDWTVLSGLLGRQRRDGRDTLKLLWFASIPLGAKE